jgi:putative membrane protein
MGRNQQEMLRNLQIGSLVLSLGYIFSFFLTVFGSRTLGDLVLLIFVCLSCILVAREWVKAPLILISGSLIGFIAEYIGLRLGAPFGSYTYNAFRAARVLGVPIPIILAWGIYLYTCYLASATLVKERWKRILVASLLMVNLDLAVDPVMVKLGLWSWSQQGPWFGVPLSNYAGWFIVSLLSLLVYAMFSGREPEKVSIIAYIPYLSTYTQLFYLAELEVLPAVTVSFLVSIIPLTLISTKKGLNRNL